MMLLIDQLSSMKCDRKKPPASPSHPAASRAENSWTSQSSLPILTASIAALTVAVIVTLPLVVSEGAIGFGTNLPATMLACVLLVGWGLVMMQQMPLKASSFSFIAVAAGLLIAWHTLSGLIHLPSSNGRYVLNATWLWLGLGAISWLITQTITTARQVRAVVAIMIAAGAVLTTCAGYQYFFSFPELRRQFAEDREAMLAGSSEQYQEGTPEYELLRNRVESREPLATFSLTNSLAGFIAPWLIAALIVALQIGRSAIRKEELSQRNWAALPITVFLLVCVATCLYLTKSRTGVLAALAGGGLFLLTNFWPSGWGRGKIILAGLVLAAVAVVGLFSLAALDADLWRGAPTSVVYRLEYWHTTVQLIGRNPLFGVGPGNFQDYYPQFKLPQASETVGDPHNFLMEVAATAGVPALLLLLATLAAIGWTIWRQPAQEVGTPAETKPRSPSSLSDVWSLYAGSLFGLLLAWPFGILVGYGGETYGETGIPIYVLFGLPAMVAVLVALHGWVLAGRWTLNDCGIVLLTLLINLLAAGSTSFPGVIITAWLMGALVAGEDARQVSVSATTADPNATALSTWVTVAISILLVLACYLTAYNPFLQARAFSADALELNRFARSGPASDAFRAAGKADPWSPTPWEGLTWIQLHVASVVGWNGALEDAFTEGSEKYIERAPHSHTAWQQVGGWKLRAYRLSGRDSFLEEAARAYERAIEFYPNDAFLHSQLAWVQHLRGDDAAAKREAEVALKLDEAHSHKERKLASRKFDDLGKDQTKTKQPLPDKNARQIMEEIAGKD